MGALKPVFITDEFKKVVAAVSADVLPTLQAYDPMIQGVNAQCGHPVEIASTLTQWSNTDAEYKKYPLCALFLDVPIVRNREIGFYGEANLHMLIARQTKPDLKAAERETYNFKPVLYPVYMSLLYHFGRSKAFNIIANQTQHTQIDRYFWGNESIFGNKGNIFSDWVDSIEIKDFKITLKQPC